MKKVFALLGLTLMFTACASDKEEWDNMSAEDLYNVSWENLEKTKYEKAASGFEKVETDHPYSKWAVKSKLMSAYSYYKNEKYDDAILALDRFIKYHPGNKDVAYAYYLKGMCYYDRITTADKDQGDTAKAEETFRLLIELFPDSKYAADARQKIKLTEDYQAGQEMNIARFYLHDGNYLSALNRFNSVLENYQTTVQIEEALYREVEIYAIFGMDKYADGYYKILRDNYPNGKWTEKAADIMEDLRKGKPKKVGDDKESVAEEVPSAEEIAEEKGFWSKTADFLWPWGNKEETAKDEVEETATEEVKESVAEEVPSAEEVTEEKGFWSKTADFLWPWGNKEEASKDEVKESVAEEVPSAEEVTEEKGFWSKTADFLWPWGNKEEKAEGESAE